MEEIKAPKKERKFLKAVGNIGKVLAEELVMGIARKFIGKVVDKVKLPKKRETLSLFLLLSFTIAFAQFPTTGNKQRLGFQTTADGLVWRGSISDTASIQPTTNQNAWLIIDTVNLKIYSFDFTSNVWGLVGGGTSGLTMPFDSITFNTAKDGTVGVGEVEYNDTQGSLIQGLKGGLVTNVIGQQLHQRVNNRTGSTLAKGTAVYLSGSQGNRITVAKALGVTNAFSANTFGIVAESIANNQSGYIITEGLITNINTSALVEDSAVYLSPTVAGGLTSTKPQAPQHTIYIGVCVKSNAGSGELFVKITNGQELNELHDVRITSPVNKASLYYLSSQGIWRDTTATLLVSDTASMLANYASKAYADTSGRFYARQDFTNVSSSTLTWTQSDTLVVGGVNVVQVYRNGQILLPTQYTIPTNASVVIGATAYKVGENYTVIFPRGGGAGSGGGGSGSLTSISGGTGIIVNPNPITTTGTVSADLSVLMELTDTSLLNLTTRFATKLNAADTTSLSNRINAKGTGTVTSVGSGFGLLGGTITTTGTLRLDTTTIYARLQDSINVAIGGDTIKILKQEYNAASSSVLTWTITPKFPIQLKAYILVFRNGQLLNNDQYNLTDTNKITIVSTSFKIGANYTVATVSGIGSVGSAQAGNPVYPEAGIALSTGSTWASSITNNSANWNTAFTDRLKWDGGSTGLVASTARTSLGGTTIGQSMFTLTNPSAITFPQFNADNSVTTLSAASFRSAIGAGTVTSVIASTTAGNPISITNNTTIPTIELLSATSARNGYLTSTDWTTFNNKFSFSDTTSLNLTSRFAAKQNTLVSGTTIKTVNGTTLLGSGNLSVGTLVSADTVSLSNRINLKVNISDTAAMLLPYLKKVDTTAMLLPYFRDNDTTLLNLSSRFNAKVNISDTLNMLLPYLRKTDTTNMLLPYLRKADTSLLNLTSRFNTKLNISDTLNMLSRYLRKADTTSMLLPYFRNTDTTLLNLTNRFNTKLNISDTSAMLLPYLRRADTTLMLTPYLRKSDTTNMLLPYFRDADTTSLNLTSRFATKLNITDTTLMLSKYLRRADTSLLNLTSRFATKLNISDTASMLTPYFRDADTTSLNLTSRFAAKQNTLTNPVTGTGTTNTLPLFTGTSTLGNSVIQQSSNNIGINTTPFASLTLGQGKNIMLDASSNNVPRLLFYETNARNENDVQFGAKIQYNSPSDRLEFVMRDSFSGDPSGDELAISIVRQTGNVTIHKPTTLSSTLAVQGDITENDNNVLTNLDTASLSIRIDAKLSPIDTVSLSSRINSKVSLTGDQTISGNKTFSGTTTSAGLTLTQTTSGTNKLLGLNSSGGAVGQITVGNGLKLLSDTLTVNERFYFDLGTVAGQADNVTGTYNFSYSGNAFIVPSSLNGYCIDTVNIRAISCTNCPPAAGEKDYYMGVYKVSAGNRVTSSGATMQGSQIVCNEYDLKEENVNHVLTTGDVWWVYLNGSYFSDMEIIKASFIVKKTCN
jgi:hypothetical protein